MSVSGFRCSSAPMGAPLHLASCPVSWSGRGAVWRWQPSHSPSRDEVCGSDLRGPSDLGPSIQWRFMCSFFFFLNSSLTFVCGNLYFDFKITSKERSHLAPSAPEELLAYLLNAGHQSSSSWKGWPGWRAGVPQVMSVSESRRRGFVTLQCHYGGPGRESPPCVLCLSQIFVSWC